MWGRSTVAPMEPDARASGRLHRSARLWRALILGVAPGWSVNPVSGITRGYVTEIDSQKKRRLNRGLVPTILPAQCVATSRRSTAPWADRSTR